MPMRIYTRIHITHKYSKNPYHIHLWGIFLQKKHAAPPESACSNISFKQFLSAFRVAAGHAGQTSVLVCHILLTALRALPL